MKNNVKSLQSKKKVNVIRDYFVVVSLHFSVKRQV